MARFAMLAVCSSPCSQLLRRFLRPTHIPATAHRGAEMFSPSQLLTLAIARVSSLCNARAHVRLS